MDMNVCTNREDTHVFYETLGGYVTYIQHTAGHSFYLNGGQANIAESRDGSITEISIATNLLTCDEAFNYTAQRSILDADIIKQCEKKPYIYLCQ